MVDQLKDLADSRLISGCVYCGGREETRDHVPSRVFLDSPLPANLPVVPACADCNSGFSLDEEYLACLIECVVAGSTDPDRVERPLIADMLRKRPSLRARIDAGKRQSGDQTIFDIEQARVRNIILKLAIGHAAFELSAASLGEPNVLVWWPISLMSPEDHDSYDASHVVGLLGEIGSRGMQRHFVAQVTLEAQAGKETSVGLVINDWVDVQEGRYRYLAVDDENELRIKIVIREYLACEVSWAR